MNLLQKESNQDKVQQITGQMFRNVYVHQEYGTVNAMLQRQTFQQLMKITEDKNSLKTQMFTHSQLQTTPPFQNEHHSLKTVGKRRHI